MADDPHARRIYKALGKAIAEARRQAPGNPTQKVLAERTGGALSRSAIANIERGHQRLAVHHLYAIADALGIHPAELLPPPDQLLGLEELATDAVLAEDPAGREFLELVVRRPVGTSGKEEEAHAPASPDRTPSPTPSTKTQRRKTARSGRSHRS